MFDNLIESKPKKSKSGRQMVLSMVFHTLIVAGGVWATRGAAETVKRILADTTMGFLEPPKATPPPPRPAAAGGRRLGQPAAAGVPDGDAA